MARSIIFLLIVVSCGSMSAFISADSTSNISAEHGPYYGYNRPGFINIDCGATQPYLPYFESDAEFIDTGINHEVSSELKVVNDPIYNTLRSFPDGKRNCYTLKPFKGRDNNYLIRAHFMYGNYDGLNSPLSFDVYIGVSLWQRVDITDPSLCQFQEIIHKPSTDVIHICLVDIGEGTPFISALLLRPLNNSIYNSQVGSLTFFSRYTTGLFSSTYPHYSRHADDMYDRLWSPLPESFRSSWGNFSISTAWNSLKNDAYEVPPSIFMGGAMPNAGYRSMYFQQGGLSPGSLFYVCWHFVETQKLGANESREFSISTSANFHLGPITLKYMEALTIVAPSIRIQSDYFFFSIDQTNASTLPPILNAVELYNLKELPGTATNQNDVDAIMDVKTKYANLHGWNGDPCLPAVAWSGLECSNDTASPRITSLNLASKGLAGEILSSLSSLTSLTYLNLSHNKLTGTIPEFLAEMPSLVVIDLRENNLSGSVPVTLMDKMNSGLELSLDGNPNLNTSDAPMKKSKKHTVLVSLVASVSSLLLLIALAVVCSRKCKRKTGLANTTTRRWISADNEGMDFS